MTTDYEWQQECNYISRVADLKGNVKEMSFSKEVFIRYCEMQRNVAIRRSMHDVAQYIQHCIDDLKA